jgi:hypothetical protein
LAARQISRFCKLFRYHNPITALKRLYHRFYADLYGNLLCTPNNTKNKSALPGDLIQFDGNDLYRIVICEIVHFIKVECFIQQL